MPTFASYVMLPELALVYADGGVWVFYLCADVESWRVFTSRGRVFAYSCIASSFINVFPTLGCLCFAGRKPLRVAFAWQLLASLLLPLLFARLPLLPQSLSVVR